jgi:hypothetical protein
VSYGEVLGDRSGMNFRCHSKVTDYSVAISFGYVLNCGFCNLYCGCFNLICNVWVFW